MSTLTTTKLKWIIFAWSLACACNGQVVNGSFEYGMTGWTSVGGLSRLGPPDRPAMGVDGSYIVTIGGADIPNSAIWQSVSVLPGSHYILSFAMAASGGGYPGRTGILLAEVLAPGSGVLASLACTNVSPGPLSGTNGFVTSSLSFQVPGNGMEVTLRFTDVSPNGGVAVDPALDNVQLELTLLSGGLSNLVANGGFERPALEPAHNHLASALLFDPWQTTEANLEIWVGPSATAGAYEGNQHLEILAQETNATVSQVIETVPGEDYTLSFYHSPKPDVDSVLTVAIDSEVVATIDEHGSDLTEFRWCRLTGNFTASSNLTTISFSYLAPTAAGTHIDHIVVVPLQPVVSIWLTQVDVCWPTVTNRSYQVQYQSDLTTNLWINLGAPVPGNGQTSCISDSIPPFEQRRFYRVIRLSE